MSFERTIADLDRLLQAEAARKAGSLDLLRSAVRNLDGSILPPVEEPGAGDGRPRRREGTLPTRPFVPMPTRTTHGGRFGPAVIARIRERALR